MVADTDDPELRPAMTWVLSHPMARAWICNNDLLRLAVDCT